MLLEDPASNRFSWEQLGDVCVGRPNLGTDVPVLIYRLLHYAMKDVLTSRFGPEAAEGVIYQSGKLAGEHFCDHVLDKTLEFDKFLAQIQKSLKDLRIGLFRVEQADMARWELTVSVAEDLDCAGLPIDGKTVCTFDEGFLAGIFLRYTGKEFSVKEVDCWCTGDRVCRFEIKPER